MSEHQTASAAGSRMRRIVRVLGPILISVGLLIGAELVLRLVGFEAELSAGGDPKANQAALFRPATRADGVKVMERAGTPVSFLAEKPAGALRVFVIGESSVWGFPYGPDLAFSQQLQQRLAAAWPNRPIEVVNCGVPGIASWHARRIVDEIVQYAPDVVLIYTGHNDWIVPGPEKVSAFTRALAHLRIYQLAVVARDKWSRWRNGPLDPSRMQAAQEPYGYARDRARGRTTMSAADRAWVATRYRDNLRAMVSAARANGATVIVASLGQNFSDFPPGASRHHPGLSVEQRARWRALLEEADALAKADDCAAALQRLAAARRIDQRPAVLHYERAKCLERVGRYANARIAYRLASNLDEVPLGAPTDFNDVMRQVAHEMNVPFVDVADALRRDSPHGLVGSALFIDHVHPSLAGHAAIARALASALGANTPKGAVAPPAPPADVDRQIAIARIPLYFVLGWYDAAAQEARAASERYPDIQLDGVIARLRAEDPTPPWDDPVAAPD